MKFDASYSKRTGKKDGFNDYFRWFKIETEFIFLAPHVNPENDRILCCFKQKTEINTK